MESHSSGSPLYQPYQSASTAWLEYGPVEEDSLEQGEPLASRHSAESALIPLNGVLVTDLARLSQDYLGECDLRLQSPRTIETRRVFIRNLIWFLHKRGYGHCGTGELRLFFYYLMHGHEESGGRFGRRHLNRPVRPITLKDYYICLRSLFAWLVGTGALRESPFVAIPSPRAHENPKAPLSPEHMDALLQAAGASAQPRRDTAILSFLLDTGCRASELTSIKVQDIDFANRCCAVLGKGNKYRILYFGAKTADALQEYLAETTESRIRDRQGVKEQVLRNRPFFLSGTSQKALTRSGLLQLLERLGRQFSIKTSCSPHAFRRTFAVQTLKNGANVFSVQAMLGHSNLQMTQKYCALAQTDVEAQHRRFSPVDRMNQSYTARK